MSVTMRARLMGRGTWRIFALTGMPGGGGILSSAIEQAANPAEPIEAYGLARRLMDCTAVGCTWKWPTTTIL
jgi:hypothetical protein